MKHQDIIIGIIRDAYTQGVGDQATGSVSHASVEVWVNKFRELIKEPEGMPLGDNPYLDHCKNGNHLYFSYGKCVHCGFQK